MLEEVMQNNEQMSQKGAKIDTKIHQKLPKGTKGGAKGTPTNKNAGSEH